MELWREPSLAQPQSAATAAPRSSHTWARALRSQAISRNLHPVGGTRRIHPSIHLACSVVERSIRFFSLASSGTRHQHHRPPPPPIYLCVCACVCVYVSVLFSVTDRGRLPRGTSWHPAPQPSLAPTLVLQPSAVRGDVLRRGALDGGSGSLASDTTAATTRRSGSAWADDTDDGDDTAFLRCDLPPARTHSKEPQNAGVSCGQCQWVHRWPQSCGVGPGPVAVCSSLGRPAGGATVGTSSMPMRDGVKWPALLWKEDRGSSG